MKTPNSQNNQSLNDEMAAELAASEYHGAERGNWGPDFEKGFISGCKYKTEQLANAGAEFDERAVFEMSVADDFKRFQGKFPDANIELIAKIVAASKVDGARWQHAQLTPIINAQTDRLKAAEQLIARLESDIKRRMNSDEACEFPFDEGFGEALNEIEKFRKGEG